MTGERPSASSYFAGLTWFSQMTPLRWWSAATVGALVVALLGLLIEHRADPSQSADNALITVTFGVVLPLLCLSAVGRTFPERVDHSLAAFARHGADRRWLLAGATTGLAVALGAIGALLAAVTRALGGSVVAEGAGDVFACAWIGAFGGVAYAAWFALGSTFGRRGGGRWLALVVDWLLGISSGIVAFPWPRGHLRNLLGGAAVAGLEQPHASAVLSACALLFVILAWFRTPR